MALNISNEAERNALAHLITDWSTVSVHLFKNDITLDADTELDRKSTRLNSSHRL